MSAYHSEEDAKMLHRILRKRKFSLETEELN